MNIRVEYKGLLLNVDYIEVDQFNITWFWLKSEIVFSVSSCEKMDLVYKFTSESTGTMIFELIGGIY